MSAMCSLTPSALNRLPQTNEQFDIDLRATTATSGSMSPYAPQSYDAVWSMALAMREAEAKWRRRSGRGRPTTTLADFDYTRTDMTQEFQRQLERQSFMGVSVSAHCVSQTYPSMNSMPLLRRDRFRSAAPIGSACRCSCRCSTATCCRSHCFGRKTGSWTSSVRRAQRSAGTAVRCRLPSACFG